MKVLLLPLVLALFSINCFSQGDQSLVYNNHGVKQMNEQDFLSAIESFTMAIELDSLNSLFFRNRAYCYFYDEQYQKAESDFLHCLSLKDEKPEYYYYLGLGRSKMDDNQKAIDYYSNAIELSPQKSDYYSHRGIAYMKTGDFETAIGDFHVAVKLNPQHAGAYFHRGQSYHMLRNDRAACVDWEVAEALSPELKAAQYEKVCSDRITGNWVDVKELTDLECFKKPVFDNVSFKEFYKYVATEVDFPASLLSRSKSVYSSFLVPVLHDGTIGEIEERYSGSDLLDKAFKKTVHKGADKWTGGTVNGIPVDFRFVGPLAFFTSVQKNEIEKLKKLIDEAVLNRDDESALQYCNEILEIHPFDIDILRMRIALNSRLGKTSLVAADQKLFEELSLEEFRYQPQEINKVKPQVVILPEDSVTVFYNEDWHITNQENAVYFRKGIWNKEKNFFVGSVSDYLMLDSTMVTSVVYGAGLKKSGPYVSFYPNGQKRAVGEFVDNLMQGEWRFYAEDGSLRYAVNFTDDYFKFRVLNDEQGNDILKAQKEKFELKLSKFISLKGAFKNGSRDKTWILEAGGDKIIQEKFSEGDFVQGFYYKNGERISLPSSGLKSVVFTPTNIAVTERLMFDDRGASKDYPFINIQVVK
ncbi:tetratricopeptide repeat protein [Marinilabilia salmonicolor]|jgi:tetratricopeptide (TPR) repeat protein|uniref:Tetratricopeptide repeat protein n=1 Tax=Marinilabilia salmonicolor TaxID=989 RepID=A0A2T0XLU2_9BACT|nr:tetratricopeptide repeat protein [Marinilabilia salmonicolor]PRY99896.1 tetratricopeptide repeat protein [Marinilabilia salmonicolor]RCW37321.1 tetratricopeptide repeat protein [Marinilabilia salmonicolor]